VTRHVLVARADGLGDVVLAGPAVRAVAASGARVTLLAGTRGLAAARRLPGVTDVIVAGLSWIDADAPPEGSAELRAFVRQLVDCEIDEAMILTSSHQSPLPLAMLLRLAGVRRIGGTSIDYPGALLDVALRHDDDVHEVERSLRLARAMGYELPAGDDGSLRLDQRASAPDQVGEGAYVVVHPGASVPARTWPARRWAELVARLGDDGCRVLVTGARAECALTAEVAAAHERAEDLGGRLTFDALLAVLASAGAVIVGNTGPAHLAAAVGAPVVSVFAPTVPAARWHPWAVPYELFGRQDIACAGCRAKVCPVAGQPCLTAAGVASVAAAAHRLAPVRALAATS
jgi:ADP-heptose:LPS heptosyltransferase